jgi:hypothetical protein
MLKIILLSLLVFAQTLHVTFTGVECFPEEGLIRVDLKMRYNDFVFDYRANINDDQIFDPSKGIDTAEILVSKYLDSKVRIFSEGKELKGQLTNIELVKDELNIDLLYPFRKKSKSFKVKNTILFNLNKKPTNLVIFKYVDFEEGVKLTEEKPDVTFNVR